MKAEKVYSWDWYKPLEHEDPPKECPSCSSTYIKLYSPVNDPILEQGVHHDASAVYLCRDCYYVARIQKGKLYLAPDWDDLPF